MKSSSRDGQKHRCRDFAQFSQEVAQVVNSARFYSMDYESGERLRRRLLCFCCHAGLPKELQDEVHLCLSSGWWELGLSSD